MRLSLPFFLLVLFCIPAIAQKKQLDHSVYDGWQSIGERKISANGEWVAYTIDVQEGDGVLVVQRTDSSFKQTFPRGYGFAFSEDNQFLVFKIKPTYLDTRNAKIVIKGYTYSFSFLIVFSSFCIKFCKQRAFFTLAIKFTISSTFIHSGFDFTRNTIDSDCNYNHFPSAFSYICTASDNISWFLGDEFTFFSKTALIHLQSSTGTQ